MKPENQTSEVPVGRAQVLATGQVTCYAARDDGDLRAGIPKPTARYQVNTTGPFLNTTHVYLPCFAQNDLIFTVVGRTITSVIGGLDIVKTGDRIRIRGSTLNDTSAAADGCYLVQTGGVANTIVLDATTPPAANENSIVPITIAKQALQSNNTVLDLNTGLLWLRYGTYSPVKLGAASDGRLLWTATAVTIHAANNDLKMTAGGKGLCTVTIINGAGEVLRYWPGYSYSFTAFVNAVNKLPGFRCVSVTVNGLDLDIVMATGNQTCITEAGPINGAINLSCNGIFGFCNAAIAAGVAGYTDWRLPNKFELDGLSDSEAPTALPDALAFPSFPENDLIWTSTTKSTDTTKSFYLYSTTGEVTYNVKTSVYYAILVRGG